MNYNIYSRYYGQRGPYPTICDAVLTAKALLNQCPEQDDVEIRPDNSPALGGYRPKNALSLYVGLDPKGAVKVHGSRDALLNNHPDIEANANCLSDMCCPICGNRNSFRISATVGLRVTDDGTESDGGDTEWDGDSPCRCDECQHWSLVQHFTFPGLDDQLQKSRKNIRWLGTAA